MYILYIYSAKSFGNLKLLIVEYNGNKSSMKSVLEQVIMRMCSGYRNVYLIRFERKHLEKKHDIVLEFKIQLK